MLYAGYNQRGTEVFTWVAATIETNFTADVSPLLQSLWRTGLLSADSYLGLVEFGSEAFHASANVTFSASGFSMVLKEGPAPNHDIGELPTACSLAGPAHTRDQGSWLSIMPIIGIITVVLYAL